jgi:hypothetical protein
VAPDGRRFVLLQQKETPPAAVKHVVLVQNWSEELQRRVPARLEQTGVLGGNRR